MSKSKIQNKPSVAISKDTKLATTIIEQGPRDDQARVDAYGTHIGPLTSQFKGTLDKYTDNLYASYVSGFSALNKSPLNLHTLKGLDKINGVIKDVKKNIDNFLDRIQNNVLGGRSIQSILALPAEFKKDAFGTFQKLVGGNPIFGTNIGKLVRDGKMLYDEGMKTYKMIKNGDWKSLDGIAKTLTAIGGTELGRLASGILDVQAIGTMLGEIVKTAASIGNHDIIKEVVSLFKSSKHRNSAMNSVVYTAALKGDIQTLDAIIKVLGGIETNKNNPKTIQYLLTAYRLDPFYTPDKNKEYRKRLFDLLNQLDPNWYYEIIDGVKVTKLEPFQYMSQDCLALFKYFDEDEENLLIEAIIAKEYKPVDIKQLTMTFYKDITFKNRPLDPRQKM